MAFAGLLSGGPGATAAGRTPGSRTIQPPMSAEGVTPCATPLNLELQSANVEANGLVVRTTLSSTCSAGDLISNSRYRVTAVDDAGHDVASGLFDLSSTPIVVPGNGDATSVSFTFPAGTYWRTPGATSGALTFAAHRDGAESSPALNTAGASSVSAIDVGTPEHGSLDAAASSALADIAAADQGYIDSNLLEVWQPQLSAKRPGLFADGITWQANDIVREHMELRQRFPGARLVWSGNWPVYSLTDWWITLAGISFGSGDTANGWCAAQGFDADHCFAKLLSHQRGTSGTTVTR